MEYQKTNREKAMTPKIGKGWCDCDRNIVHYYGKCSVCGIKLQEGNRLKKETNA